MKYAIAIGLLLALSTGSGAVLAAEHKHGMDHADMRQAVPAATKAMPLNDGVAKKVDMQNGKVTLQHGDIANVMPAMTMSYRVKQAQQLEAIRAGDKVRFAMDKLGDDYVVTHIEAVR